MSELVMEGQEQNPEGSTTPETPEGTQIPKFKSAEDRDRAYLELEKRAHETAQELSEMKRKLEDFSSSVQMQQQAPAAPEQSFTDAYKTPDELKKFWENFAQRPQEVFNQWRQDTINEIRKEQMVREMARDAVSDFKAKHPDLAQYEEIVSIFVQRQPQNLSARERLERAAPEARKMIASIAQKGGSQPQHQDPSTYVESPSANRDGAPKIQPKPVTEESDLAEYLRETREYQAKKAVPPRTRA